MSSWQSNFTFIISYSIFDIFFTRSGKTLPIVNHLIIILYLGVIDPTGWKKPGGSGLYVKNFVAKSRKVLHEAVRREALRAFTE
jgi:hypothetical protein